MNNFNYGPFGRLILPGLIVLLGTIGMVLVLNGIYLRQARARLGSYAFFIRALYVYVLITCAGQVTWRFWKTSSAYVRWFP